MPSLPRICRNSLLPTTLQACSRSSKPTEAQRKLRHLAEILLGCETYCTIDRILSTRECHCSRLSSLGALYLRDAVSQIVPPRAQVPYLLRRAESAAVGLAGDFIRFQFPPNPLTGEMRLATRAVQDPSRRKACSQRYQVRPVRIWTRSRQVSSVAFWAFDAMTKAKHSTT